MGYWGVGRNSTELKVKTQEDSTGRVCVCDITGAVSREMDIAAVSPRAGVQGAAEGDSIGAAWQLFLTKHVRT